jgi:hypothetical protein
MTAHYAYACTSVLGTIRAPQRKSVSLHCAPRHPGIDLKQPTNYSRTIYELMLIEASIAKKFPADK